MNHAHVWQRFTLRTKAVEHWTRFDWHNTRWRVKSGRLIYTGWRCFCGEQGYAA